MDSMSMKVMSIMDSMVTKVIWRYVAMCICVVLKVIEVIWIYR